MLGITIGDPSGIGAEIILKALSSVSLRAERDNLLLIGNRKILEGLNHRFSQDFSFLSRVNLVESSGYFSYKFGKPQKQCGIASMLQLHCASHLLKTGKLKGVVTAPVSKTALKMAGFPFAGQTEYFAREFGVEKYAMLGWSEQIKIALATIHTPLKQLPRVITTQNVLDKIILLNNYLKTYEKIKIPRIGVFALNPHAFEFSCGAEQKILKAIKQAHKLGIRADGPLAADSALSFSTSNGSRITYHGFVSMYHDQGMLPVKLTSKGKGVNVTIGLPFIRTSPLHGVAFDIAGKNLADPSSMISAIKLCQKLIGYS